MALNNSITKHSIIAGFFVCAIFPLLIFSESYFVDLCIKISDFGVFWNPIFWGVLFPLFQVFLFWNSGKKISHSLNQITYFQACSQFSFAVSSKIIIALFTLYIIGQFVNGISVVLQSQIYDQIVFSILMILFLSFLLMIMTFISSLIIIKLSQDPQTLNKTQ
ncbi:hypothetical protein [Flavobacterium hydatis]|uniref:DUF2975 domain-containing protein n=1 Tax=Flavobacterium hydatis TaxID=991 RepID=A0A086AT87_FLAHY|nr:hypothetical protein [Flavobacterium hydatis]KFF19901.1 hypothetical protein IW20_01880 [Flavobacterium hydatis]OXA91534.1 hypothetical protein B0A62_17825 [Flavobacterium hydatis]